MAETLQARDFYTFGEFRLDTRERVLLRHGEPIALTPKAFELLLALVSRHGRIVEKDALMAIVWPDTFVEEGNLTFQISALRKSLGEGFIETVPRRGYRFARVEPASEPAGAQVDEGQPERASPWVRWKTGAVVLSVLGVGAATLIAFRFATSEPDIRSIAVLPFQAPKGMEDLGVGLADALILRLGNSEKLRLRPTSAIYPFVSGPADPIKAGQQLQVDAVVTGMLQRSGNRTRATLQLIRVADGKMLSSSQFDQDGTDVFGLEDGLSRQLAGALAARLTGEQRTQLAQHADTDPETHRLVLMGRYQHYRQTQTSLKLSIESFQQAVVRDPRYAPAWAGLAKSYFGLVYLGGAAPLELMPKAHAAALKSIELDPDLGQGHAALAFVQMWFGYDLPAAKISWRRALQLDPRDRDALDAQALDALFQGRFQESIDVRKSILEDNPTEPFAYVNVGRSLFFAGRYAEAHAYARKALEVDPNYSLAYAEQANIYRLEKQYGQSFDAILRQRELNHADPAYSAKLQEVFARGGIRAWDQLRLDEALERSRSGKRVGALALAGLYRDFGNADQAMNWLDKAYADRDPNLMVIKTFPPWHALQGNVRYEALLKKLGLLQRQGQ